MEMELEPTNVGQPAPIEPDTNMVYRGYRLPYKLVGELYKLADDLHVSLDKALEIAVYTGSLAHGENQPDQEVAKPPAWAVELQNKITALEKATFEDESESEDYQEDTKEIDAEEKPPAPPKVSTPILKFVLSQTKKGREGRDYIRSLLAPDGHRDGRIARRRSFSSRDDRAKASELREFLTKPGAREELLRELSGEFDINFRY